MTLEIISDVDEGLILLRRIPCNIYPGVKHIVFNDSERASRPSSAAFGDNDSEPLSVTLSDCLGAMNRSLESALSEQYVGRFALAGIQAKLVIDQGYQIYRDPTDEEPCHGLIVGGKTAKFRKYMARNSFWVVEPNVIEL